MNLRSVARGWWLVVITTGLAVAAAWLYSWNAPDLYQARGTYVIGPSNSLTQPESIVRSFDSLQGQGIVPTLVELLSSTTIAEEVAADLDVSREALERYELRASVLSDSNTLELAATGPDPELTAALTRGVGQRASAVFEDLYSVYEIRPLDEPTAPEDRYSPQPVRNMMLALLLGLTAGCGLALLRARFVEGPEPDLPSFLTAEAGEGGVFSVAAIGPGHDSHPLLGAPPEQPPGDVTGTPSPAAGAAAAASDGDGDAPRRSREAPAAPAEPPPDHDHAHASAVGWPASEAASPSRSVDHREH